MDVWLISGAYQSQKLPLNSKLPLLRCYSLLALNPAESGGEAENANEGACGLLVASCNGSPLLEPRPEPLDLVAVGIDLLRARYGCLVALRLDGGPRAHAPDVLAKAMACCSRDPRPPTSAHPAGAPAAGWHGGAHAPARARSETRWRPLVIVRSPPDTRYSPGVVAGWERQGAHENLWGNCPVGGACFPYASQSGFLGSKIKLDQQISD